MSNILRLLLNRTNGDKTAKSGQKTQTNADKEDKQSKITQLKNEIAELEELVGQEEKEYRRIDRNYHYYSDDRQKMVARQDVATVALNGLLQVPDHNHNHEDEDEDENDRDKMIAAYRSDIQLQARLYDQMGDLVRNMKIVRDETAAKMIAARVSLDEKNAELETLRASK